MSTIPLSVGETLVQQAEDMDRDGYRVVDGYRADEGQLVKARADEATLSSDFEGPGGTYTLTLFAQDECDGQSTIEIFVDGVSVGTIVLDNDNNGGGSNNGRFSEISLEGVDIPEGASIEVVAHRDGGEFARIDKLEFTLNELAEAEAQAEPDTPAPVTVQAEDMVADGFYTVSGAQADGGQLVRASGCDGTLSTTFSGATATYDISIFAQDETDGCGYIEIYVDGVLVDGVSLTRQSDGVGSNNGSFSEFVFEGVEVANGAEIEIRGYRDGGEMMRIDKMELNPVEGSGQEEPVDPDAIICVDLDDLATGATVDGQYDGVTITAWRAQDGPNGSNAAMVFDSANPTGGDWDLQTPDQGKVLIISEDFDANDPDDNAAGGTFEFTFDQPSHVGGLTIIDIEESGNVRFYDADGSLIEEIWMPTTGDGEVAQVPFNVSNVSFMTITLCGSGAIDNIYFHPETPDEPEVVYAALDDVVTVSETEGFDGADLLDDGSDQITDNDTQDGAGYSGDVLGVNGDAGNVAQVVAGSNGGLIRINADGTFDFSANGDFDALDEGQSATTTFTYEIAGGETATVTVVVEGETFYVANDDVLTVSETEGFDGGDALDNGETDVKANDTKDGGDYAGDVLGVNGSAGNVAAQVAGSNGGLLVLNADGSFDFSANGDFDALDEGQSATTTFTYEIAGGETATVTVVVEGETFYVANDDVLTVSETEGFDGGDALDDGSDQVTDNDTKDGGAYSGAVLAVNAAAGSVAQEVAGSNGGLLIINADGTFDFSANGDFDALDDGQSDETTFTYEIAGGETATVTVVVEGETFYVANDDVLTVTESETFDGDDILDNGEATVTANDTKDAGTYTGDVLSVNGDAAGVAQQIAGSNGGLLVINADGSFDFSANGEFDDLDEGETAQTTFTYGIEGGETATVTVNVLGENLDTAAIGDFVFLDEDEDGLQGENEEGLSGVMVKLYDSTGAEVGSVVSDENGAYAFTGLAAGDYVVGVEFDEDTYFLTDQNAGNGALDSDINDSTNLSDTITLGAGEVNNDIDIGLVEDGGGIFF